MITLKDLGGRLKELRESLGFSQDYVARQSGMTGQAIIAIESGRRKVDSFELFRLAALYNVEVMDLMTEKAVAPSVFEEAMTHVRLSSEEREKLLEFQKICEDYSRFLGRFKKRGKKG